MHCSRVYPARHLGHARRIQPVWRAAGAKAAKARCIGRAGRAYYSGLLGRQAQLRRMRATVMLGQDLARLSGLMCDSALANLTADYRKAGNGHREAAGSG